MALDSSSTAADPNFVHWRRHWMLKRGQCWCRSWTALGLFLGAVLAVDLGFISEIMPSCRLIRRCNSQYCRVPWSACAKWAGAQPAADVRPLHERTVCNPISAPNVDHLVSGWTHRGSKRMHTVEEHVWPQHRGSRLFFSFSWPFDGFTSSYPLFRYDGNPKDRPPVADWSGIRFGHQGGGGKRVLQIWPREAHLRGQVSQPARWLFIH